ncbi:MAG: pilin [Candidatus Doudnabacteria bacterium]
MKENQKTKIAILVFFVLVTLAVTARPVHADIGLVQCGQTDSAGVVTNPCDFQDLVVLLIRVINLLLGFSWLVATFFVFWGAYKMISAFGNSEGIANGKETLRQALVGFFLVLVAFVLLNFVVASFTGYNFNFSGSDSKSIIKFLP